MSQGITHTLCLRSSDATRLSDGAYRWSVNAANLTTASSKMYLASIELPMSQWSIEEAWHCYRNQEQEMLKSKAPVPKPDQRGEE